MLRQNECGFWLRRVLEVDGDGTPSPAQRVGGGALPGNGWVPGRSILATSAPRSAGRAAAKAHGAPPAVSMTRTPLNSDSRIRPDGIHRLRCGCFPVVFAVTLPKVGRSAAAPSR